jgi:hypothetical protein
MAWIGAERSSWQRSARLVEAGASALVSAT